MNTQTVTDFKDLPEAMNTLQIIQALKRCSDRLDALEANMKPKLVKEKKELRYIKLSKYILEVLADGKIHSAYSIEEQIKSAHADLPAFTHIGVGLAARGLVKKGIIAKVAFGNFRRI